MRSNKFLFDYVGGQVDDLKGENVGDFKCHDFLNHPDCLYDMGDCCELDVAEDEGDTCYSCHCYADSKSSGEWFYHKTNFPYKLQILFYQGYAVGVCGGSPQFIADGFCDDENNNQNCFFDGGDCCFNVATVFCSECKCFYGEYV